jgi:hypothetical protein
MIPPFFQMWQPVKATKNYKLIKEFRASSLCIISSSTDSRYIKFYRLGPKCHPVAMFVITDVWTTFHMEFVDIYVYM